MRLAYAQGIKSLKRNAGRRTIGSVKGEMIAMLQIQNVAAVPTDSCWTVLYKAFGAETGWSIEKLARFIDVSVEALNRFMANLAVESACLGDYANTEDFIHAIERAK